MKMRILFLSVVSLVALDASAKSFEAAEFHVEFGDRFVRECSFVPSPIDYCDDNFVKAYREALDKKVPDFGEGMIVVAIDSRPEYAQQSLVVIDPRSRTVFPFAFDFFTKSFDGKLPYEHGTLLHKLGSNKICVQGKIMAYRSTQGGDLCWTLKGDKFVGSVTPYTYPDG